RTRPRSSRTLWTESSAEPRTGDRDPARRGSAAGAVHHVPLDCEQSSVPFETEIRPVPGSLADTDADLVAIPVRAADTGPEAVTAAAGDLDARLPAPLAELVAHYELTGKAGETAQFAADLGRGLVRVAL